MIFSSRLLDLSAQIAWKILWLTLRLSHSDSHVISSQWWHWGSTVANCILDPLLPCEQKIHQDYAGIIPNPAAWLSQGEGVALSNECQKVQGRVLLKAAGSQVRAGEHSKGPNASGKTKFGVSIPTEYEPFSSVTLGSQTQQKGRGVSVPFSLGRAVLVPRHSLLNTPGKWQVQGNGSASQAPCARRTLCQEDCSPQSQSVTQAEGPGCFLQAVSDWQEYMGIQMTNCGPVSDRKPHTGYLQTEFDYKVPVLMYMSR